MDATSIGVLNIEKNDKTLISDSNLLLNEFNENTMTGITEDLRDITKAIDEKSLKEDNESKKDLKNLDLKATLEWNNSFDFDLKNKNKNERKSPDFSLLNSCLIQSNDSKLDFFGENDAIKDENDNNQKEVTHSIENKCLDQEMIVSPLNKNTDLNTKNKDSNKILQDMSVDHMNDALALNNDFNSLNSTNLFSEKLNDHEEREKNDNLLNEIDNKFFEGIY